MIANPSCQDTPLISIITVVKNGRHAIEKTIQSVLNQNYPNLEYIIIDGGSTDGTQTIISKYNKQLKGFISEPDHGIYHAMNKGIAMANGELIGILNAGDWYEENILEQIANEYLSSDRQTIIHGMMRNFEEEHFYNITGNSIRRLRYDMIQHPTCFLPIILYQRYGSFDLSYRYSADYDFVLRLVDAGVSFRFIEKIITNFQLGGVSSTPKADHEMWKVRAKHHLISNKEAWIRLTMVFLATRIKKIL